MGEGKSMECVEEGTLKQRLAISPRIGLASRGLKMQGMQRRAGRKPPYLCAFATLQLSETTVVERCLEVMQTPAGVRGGRQHWPTRDVERQNCTSSRAAQAAFPITVLFRCFLLIAIYVKM